MHPAVPEFILHYQSEKLITNRDGQRLWHELTQDRWRIVPGRRGGDPHPSAKVALFNSAKGVGTLAPKRAVCKASKLNFLPGRKYQGIHYHYRSLWCLTCGV